MKKIYSLILLACMVLTISCQDEVDLSDLSFPPSVLSMTPAADGNVPIGGFDLKVVFVDGVGSPLSEASVVLKDAADNEIYSVEEDLSGTKDSVFVEGEMFDAANLGEGDYTMIVTAKDVNGLTTNINAKFKIVNSLFNSIQTEMYLAGEFNGWGSAPLTLVSDNTWKIENVNLSGGKWKFKNRTDWSDTDWGDVDCDGVMAVTSGGGPDTNCGFTGLSHVTFNDKTLAYTVVPAVNHTSTVSNLYWLGSVNNFQGSTYRFALISNNTWELTEVRIKPGDKFKFVEGPESQGSNFGDSNNDGIAEKSGPYGIAQAAVTDAYYKVTFNDLTLAYTFTFVRFPYPSELYLVGDASPAGWNETNPVPFKKLSDGKFEIYVFLNASPKGFKFLQGKTWSGDWGKGETDGSLVQEGEHNVEVSADGFYRVTVDFTQMKYEVLLTNWGLVGSARTGDDTGWNADTNMTFVSGHKWTVTLHLFAGKFKFRANDGWDINFGDANLDGVLGFNEGDMPIAAEDDYKVEMDLDPVNGYKYTVTPQ